FFFTVPSTPELSPLSLHDALPILRLFRRRQKVDIVSARQGTKACKRFARGTITRNTNQHAAGIGDAVRKSRDAHQRAVKIDSRRSEEHTSELQSLAYLVCRLLLEK